MQFCQKAEIEHYSIQPTKEHVKDRNRTAGFIKSDKLLRCENIKVSRIFFFFFFVFALKYTSWVLLIIVSL